MGFILRDYQEEGTKACVDILQSKKRTCKELVISPTAGGKSIYVAETVKRVNEPILILQPSKELLLQNYEKFVKVGGAASICCASLKVKTRKGIDYTQLANGDFVKCRDISRVTYATVGTVKKYAQELKKLGVKKALIDECFPYKTPVVTSEGTRWIGEIHEDIKKGKEVVVKSFNEKENIFEYKKVSNSKNNGIKNTFKVYYSNSNSIECTYNHKILTIRGWVEAHNLKKGDAIICSEKNANNKTLNLLNQDQTDLVIGASLGDGNLDYRGSDSYSCRVKMIQGEEQKEYLYWKANILNSSESVYKIENNGYSNNTAYSVNTKCFYFKEKYKNYKYLISKLNFRSLAILWMDDGNLSKYNNSGTLYSLCNNKELVILLNSKLKELGIRDTIVAETKSSSTGNTVYYIRFRKTSINDLSNNCAKYVHKTMQYKVLPKTRYLTGTYIWNINTHNTVKLFKKFEKSKIQEVYDIEVEDNHNFIISSKSAYKKSNYNITSNKYKNVLNEGIVVHNCHLSTKSGSQVRKLFKDIGITHIVGLTATALYLEGGMNGASLKMMNRARWKLFSNIRYVTQIPHLVKNKYWSKLLYQVNDTDETYLQENSNGSDFTVQSQKEYYKANNLKEQIIEEVRNLQSEGRKSILVFVPTIDEAEDLFASFSNSATVHSKMDTKTRDYVVQAFKDLTIPVVFNVNVLSCLDLETEVLTESGWTSYNEMSYNHKVANWDNGKIFFKTPSNIIYKDIEKDEHYCTYESNSINFRVTNNHDLLLRNQRQKNYSKVKAGEVNGRILKTPVFGEYTPEQITIPQEKRNLKSSLERRISANSYNIRKRNPKMSIAESKWVALRDIEQRNNLKYKNPHQLTNEECELIGFFLGDSSKCIKGKNENIHTLSQSLIYPKIVNRIDELLSICNISHSKHTKKKDKKSKYKSITWQLNKGTGYGIQEKEGIYKLIPFLDKNGSKYLKYLTKEQFKNLIKGFWLADGNHGDSENKSSRGFNITNTNYNLLSLIQEISVTRGIKANIKKLSKPRKENHKQLFMLQLSDSKDCTINNKYKIVKEKFKKEKTWCVTVPSSNIIIRRKGKVMVVGNCGFDHPELDAIITSRSTSSIALFYQQIGRGVRIHPEKEDCKVVDFSGNVKRFGRVEGLHYENVPYYGWGLFNEKNELLTDFPIAAKNRPTKESLIEAGKKESEDKEVRQNPEFTFGMFKGRKLWDIAQGKDSARLKSYCSWFWDKYSKGQWDSRPSIVLVEAIREYLKIPKNNSKANGLPF